MTAVLAALAALLFAAPSAPGARGQRGEGGIDWVRRAIRARAQGAPDLDAPSIAVARLGAERAARADALRRLLSAVEGAPLAEGGAAERLLRADAALRAKTEESLRVFSVDKAHYFSDGAVVLDVEVSLDRLPPELLRALLRPTRPMR